MEAAANYLTILAFISAILASFCESLEPPYYGIDRPSFEYELPPLEFGFSELEPYLDEQTLRVHYLGHHSKYTQQMNTVLKDWRSKDKLVSRISIVDILRNLNAVPEEYRTALKNNGGGFVNHNIYWAVLAPNQRGFERRPPGPLLAEIEATWGSYASFKKAFTEKANGLFGSGYVWLCRNYTDSKSASELMILSTPNQDCPLSQSVFPMLVIDIWEHAYYLKHQNQRANYVDSWWMLVEWEAAARLDEWWKGAVMHDEL